MDEAYDGKSEEQLYTDGRTHRKKIPISSCILPSVRPSLGRLRNIRFALFFGKIKEPTKVSKIFPFRTSLFEYS